MFQLAVSGVSKTYGTRVVLDQVSFTVRPGEHVGVVGENGAGKSTLLRLLAGLELPDDGTVTVTAEGGIGHLDQTLDLPPGHTVQDAIDHALADLRDLERRVREAAAALAATPDADLDGALAVYGDLLTAFEARGGYEADLRVDAAIDGLGLGHLVRARRLGSLSGGEQARLALACVLAAAPELLLLDEPTNHLDGASLTWLEDRLRGHRGTVVAVSHDRMFLDRVATAIIEVDADRRTVARHGGGYAGYLAAKATARQRWEFAYQAWRAEIRHLSGYAATTAHRVAHARPMRDRNKTAYDRHGGRVQSSIASRVRNAEERLRRLRADPVPEPPDPLRFNIRVGGGAVSGVLAGLTGVTVGDRLDVPDLTVAAGERLLIHGPNGAGKTTLLRVLAGELPPDRGAVRRRGRVGYLPQELPRETARPGPGGRPPTLLTAFADGRGDHPDAHADTLLSLGLFRREDLHVPVASLSVGQHRRLVLARLLVDGADLLLLDEPTNHLALSLVEELETALASFPGALVVVSHDRLLRQRFTGPQREMRAGRLHAA